MRRRNWLSALLLCAVILLVMAQTARAEPETIPDDEGTTGEVVTTTRARSTYDWEALTDIHGVTLYPPPPDDDDVSNGPTTTTIKTSRTTQPFQINPDHPEDTYTGALPNGNMPNFYVEVTDQYGNVVTSLVSLPPTTETTTEETTTEEISTEEAFQESEGTERPFHWAIAAAAGVGLVAALAGGIAMLAKRKKDDDDDYIYEEPPEE